MDIVRFNIRFSFLILLCWKFNDIFFGFLIVDLVDMVKFSLSLFVGVVICLVFLFWDDDKKLIKDICFVVIDVFWWLRIIFFWFVVDKFGCECKCDSESKLLGFVELVFCF